jgi:hypothetical protein
MVLEISAAKSASPTAPCRIATENAAARKVFDDQAQHIAAQKVLHIMLARDGVLMRDHAGTDFGWHEFTRVFYSRWRLITDC